MLRTNLVYSNFLISNINKDMMINSNDEEKSFFSIVKNLYRVNFKSSYIYVFHSPVVHYQYEQWIMPENLYLKSYHIGQKLQRVEPPEQQISIYSCIANRYMPQDRRYTFVMVPLLAANAECWFAAPEFACDNAAGVAVYGAWRKQGGKLWQF